MKAERENERKRFMHYDGKVAHTLMALNGLELATRWVDERRRTWWPPLKWWYFTIHPHVLCCMHAYTRTRIHTHTHTPRPTLEHCSKVKQKDTTWTGSEIRGCAKLWDEQRATLAETLKIKEVLGMQTVYSSLQFVQVVTEAHLELLEVMPVWKTLAITTPQVACRLDLF